MSQQPLPATADGIPRWLIWVGSVAVLFHLGAVGVNALAAQSGPWPDNDGRMLMPPLLAFKANESFAADYLKPMRMNLTYHVHANRPTGTPGVYLEFRVKDQDGNEINRLNLPEDSANAWVRHRQSLLAVIFGQDQVIAPPQSELIAAPGQEVPKVQYWDMDKGLLKLKTIDINQIPRDHPVSGPDDFTFLLARSYARFLCRTYGAAKVEIIRHHQDPIRPFVLTQENFQARQFDEIRSTFGEFSK